MESINWNAQKVKLQEKLGELDPASKEYGIVFGRLKDIEQEERTNKEFEIKIAKEEYDIAKKRQEAEHKIELENKEFDLKAERDRFDMREKQLELDHKIEIENIELEHKIELENNEFELKTAESERASKIRLGDDLSRTKDIVLKFLCDASLAFIGGGIKSALIAKSYLFESEGHVLPTRNFQFVNSLNK